MKRFGIPFEHVRTGPVVGAGILGGVRAAVRICIGALQVASSMRRAKPDVVLVTGGYVSVPVAIAARLSRIPLAMYLPDAQPGRAAAFIARLADKVFVTHPDVAPHIGSSKAIVTGYPVRHGLRERDRVAARKALHAADDRPLVLVFGGSQGARHLNVALAEAADSLLPSVDVIHVSGGFDHSAAQERSVSFAPDSRKAYKLSEYLHDGDMLDALAAADLVISRAGAAVLGEYPARGLPSILVPLPISRGHQWANARLLESAGAAVLIADEELDGHRLQSAVMTLVEQPEVLERMGGAATALDRPGAAEGIALGLLELAGPRSAA